MRCPLCENYFDGRMIAFHKLCRKGLPDCRVCPSCYVKNGGVL